MNNILSVATDSALAIWDNTKAFWLKQAIPNVFSVCVIHRQHLVTKNLSECLHSSLDCHVIRAVNKIKKCVKWEIICSTLENDEDYNSLLFNTEVRWLSKSACLDQFYALFDSVLELLESKDNDLQLNLKNDIAYMIDLFAKFSKTNLKLQGDQLNLIKTKSIISACEGLEIKWLFLKKK